MAKQANNAKQQECIPMNLVKKIKKVRKEPFRANLTSQETDQTSVDPHNGDFLCASPRNPINDSLNRSLDEEIRKLQMGRKSKNWLSLNTNKQCKMLKTIKKDIVKIDASVLKFRDKLEDIMASEVQLQQQFLISVRFIELADEHLLRMSKVNRNLKYSIWFAEVQQTKNKIIQVSETRLLFNVQLLNETLVRMECDMNAVKKRIEQSLHNPVELKAHSKLVSQSSGRITSLKKNMDKEFRKLYFKLELKQATLLKVHKFCISIIRLLDILLPYFKKANCGCDLIIRTIILRKELATLANYA